jgi:hypothetical protein
MQHLILNLSYEVQDDEIGGACSTNREKMNVYTLLGGKPDGKRPVGRPRCGWVENIKMDLAETEWGGVDWTGLAQNKDNWRNLVNAVMNFRVP